MKYVNRYSNPKGDKMKKTLLVLLLLPIFCHGQETQGQRFQLFQGTYITSSLQMSEKQNKIIEVTDDSKITNVELFKIDTKTGDVWYLKSSIEGINYMNGSSETSGGFGWCRIEDYKSFSFGSPDSSESLKKTEDKKTNGSNNK